MGGQVKKPIKRPRGRPATGRDPSIATRFPRETIERVSKFAKDQKISRSEAIRRLVERALATIKP
jgi:hypothetical protein